MPQAATANMLLVQPSENGDSGVWDVLLTTLFALVDAHDHSAGKGVKVKPNGMTIDADLTMTSSGTAYTLKDAKGVDFTPQTAASMTAYAGCLFTRSDDANNLYFRNQAGALVRITNGSTLDTTTSGGIGGDYASIPAELNFTDASKTYSFRSTAAGAWSRIQAGALRITEFGTTESTYVELACPAALGGNYTITFPTAAPGSTSIVQMSSAGVLTASNTVANAVSMSSTLGVTGLITATAGVAAAAGQHITVSGAGEYKHGDLTMNVSPHAGFGTGGISNSGGTFFVSGGSGTDWFLPVPLKVGDRVKSITWYYQRGAGTLTFSFRATTLSAGTDADVGTPPTSAAGTTYTNITQSAINKTLVSTEGYYLRFIWSVADAGTHLNSVQIVYDRP